MVTRQRRNAESLLVLAGSRRSRAWSEAVQLSDVIRGSISEVADMGRVEFDLAPGNDLLVSGSAAVDLSHLLAELIENATSYSNPATSVQLRVQRSGVHVRIWVIDSGVGMSDSEMAAANERLLHPPEIDELSTDQVGFQVVGRLAQRLGATVHLQSNPVGGVAAGVDLSPSVFEPLTGDLPIVAEAEAEVLAASKRSADPASSQLPSLALDVGTLADLDAASEVELDDAPALTFGDDDAAPADLGGLPRRVRGEVAAPVTPLFQRGGQTPDEPGRSREPARRCRSGVRPPMRSRRLEDLTARPGRGHVNVEPVPNVEPVTNVEPVASDQPRHERGARREPRWPSSSGSGCLVGRSLRRAVRAAGSQRRPWRGVQRFGNRRRRGRPRRCIGATAHPSAFARGVQEGRSTDED
ncbi:MAG: ATP-binding protein [Ilumatobacteraceae bacterium]